MGPRYRCTGFISVSSSGNGVLYPIYGREGVNSAFVQEVDSDGKIHDSIEFLELDQFRFFHINASTEKAVGDYGLFAFFLGKELCVHDHQSLGQSVRLGHIDLESNELPSLTRLGLARVSGIGGDRQLSIYSEYLRSCRIDSVSTSRMVRVDRSLIQLQSYWWNEVYRFENSIGREADEVRSSSTDDIIHWLTENPVDNDWKLVCEALLRRVIFDDRVGDILVKFVNESEDFAEYDFLSKVIVGRGIDLYSESNWYQGDFEEILFDSIIDGSIFYLFSALSKRTMSRFFDSIIDKKESEGDHIYIIDSIIDFIAEGHVVPKLAGYLVDILVRKDLTVRHSERTFFEGYCRLDRLVHIYETNSIVRMHINRDESIEFLSQAISEGYGLSTDLLD